jgi:hypothetical protein
MPSPILVPMLQRKVMGKKKVFILVLRRPVLLIKNVLTVLVFMQPLSIWS